MVQRRRVKIRSSEIICLSMTELMLLVTFALLVVIAIAFRDLYAAQQMAEGLEGFTPETVGRVNELGVDSREIMDMLYPEQSAEADNGPDAHAALSAAEALIEQLKKDLSDPAVQDVLAKSPLPDIWSTLVTATNEAAEAARLKSEIAELLEKNEELEKENDLLTVLADTKGVTCSETRVSLGLCEDRLDTCSSQMGALSRSCGGTHPPCWMHEDSIDYVLDVYVFDTAITARPAWKKKGRTQEVAGIMGRRVSEELETYSHTGFWQHFEAFLLDGRSQSPQCRHYVRVWDRTGKYSKRQWQSGLEAVEANFYKLRMR